MKADIARLERAVIKTAMVRYRIWLKRPFSFGRVKRAADNLITACKALYDATEQARAIKGRK